MNQLELFCRNSNIEMNKDYQKDICTFIRLYRVNGIWCGKIIKFPDNGDSFFYRISLNKNEALELQLLSPGIIFPNFPTNRYTKWFDYDKIINCLELRTRRTGDYLTIAGKDGELSHKSLKDYMITEKIPRNDRERILLLAEGQHVVWLIGYRISEYYKISRNTKRILQVQLIGRGGSSETEEKNGGTCQSTFNGGRGR